MMMGGTEGSENKLEIDSGKRSSSVLLVAANSVEAKSCEAAKQG